MRIQPFSYQSNNVQSSDPATAFNTAAGITGTTATAVSTLVTDLQSYGLWDKLIMIYPFVGGTATSTKFNLKNPRDTNDAFRISWSGGLTYSVSGVTGSLTAVGNTNYFMGPQNQFFSIGNTMSVGAYRIDQKLTPTGAPTNRLYLWGDITNANSTSISYYTLTGTTNHFFQNTDTGTGAVNVTGQTGTTGYFVSNRTSSTSHKAFKNGAQFGTTNTVANPYPTTWYQYPVRNNPMGLFVALNDGLGNYNSDPTLNFFHLGFNLTDTDVANLYTAVQTFNTTLGRNV
jgi:hypothetical protein